MNADRTLIVAIAFANAVFISVLSASIRGSEYCDRNPAQDPAGGAAGVRIGVGKVHWFEPPLPPNRTGGSPASGSPVGGIT